MLQLKNSTPFKASIMLLPDRSGIDTLFTVVKGTFSIGEKFGLAAEQLPVTLAHEHYGDPAATSIRAPSDVSIGKLGTDVLVTGSAWAPDGKPTWQMDVSVAVGPVSKTVRVFGDRAWDASGAVATMAWVSPFVRMPLVWERAFGGSDETEKGSVAESRNPVGAGFRAANGAKALGGMALPNIEDPGALIASWKDAPAPAAFAAVAEHWLPRRTYAGTYDEAWQQNRSPYLPSDFDPRFCQVAPVGLVTPRHLTGGEIVALHGMTSGGALRFSLPAVNLQVAHRLERGQEIRAGVLDTVIIEPDESRLTMVWRAALSCDKSALKVREVEPKLASTAQVAA